MMRKRRAVVIRLAGDQEIAGDKEIAGAIAEGMAMGIAGGDLIRHGCAVPPSPKGEGMVRPGKVQGRLLGEQREAVEAEIDRQRILEDLVRVASGSRYTPEEYRDMIAAARAGRERCERRPGPARRLGRRIMGLYGLLVLGMAAAYRSQDAVLGGRE